MGVAVVATIQAKRYVNKSRYIAHKVDVALLKPGCVTLDWDGGALLFDLDELVDLVRILQISAGAEREIAKVTNYNVWTK